MKLPHFSVNRPVTTVMIFIAVVLLGFISLTNLSQELFPPISYPQLTVVTPYENAAPEEIETLITKAIEEAVGTVSGSRKINSISKEGLSLVTVEFGWDQDMDFAALGVREKLDLIKERLPRDADEPVVMKFNPFEMPVMTLSVTGKRHPASLRELCKRIIKNELEKIDGVASAGISGGLEREISIEIDRGRLEASQTSIVDVVKAIQNANLNYPAGTVEESFYEYLIRTLGEFTSVNQINDVVVAFQEDEGSDDPAQRAQLMDRESKAGGEGRLIFLKDIARINDTFKERTSYSRYNGVENISIAIQKQAQANTIKVADEVKRVLERVTEELPRDIKVDIIYDQSIFIKDAIKGVRDAAIQGGVLAFLILLFFLRNWRSATIVTFSIPISIMAAFSLMYFGKLSLNMMSLGGLAMGVGMLVDNAIVVIENIFRYRYDLKFSIKEAAIEGASEMTNAISASTLTTIAVFLPMIFIIGIAGQIFKPLAFTVTFSLVASLFVALTLIPLLASRSKKRKKRVSLAAASEEVIKEDEEGAVLGKSPFIMKAEEVYGKVLERFLRRKYLGLFFVLVIFLASMILILPLEKELMPKVDQGQFILELNMPSGTRLGVTDRVSRKVEDFLKDIPEIKNASVTIGSTKGSGLDAAEALEKLGSHQAQIIVELKKKRKRNTRDVVQYIKESEPKLPLEGARIEYVLQEGIAAAAEEQSAPIVIEINGEDLSALASLTHLVEREISKVKGVYGIKNSIAEPSPETKVTVKKDKALTYGLSVTDVALAAQIAIKGSVATEYREKGEEVDVRVRLRKEDRDSLPELDSLLIYSSEGFNVPLGAIATFDKGRGPSEIKRVEQQRVVLVFANIYKRALNEVVGDIKSYLKNVEVPQGYSVKVAGESEEMEESFDRLKFILLLSVLLVYMIMAAQFESLWQPFVIMFTVPLSLIGVLIALYVTHTSINVVAILGVIMLGGIVVNNGIVLIDYTNMLLARGKDTYAAVVEASRTRLRPIMMTALTTILGLFPMALRVGEGSELRSPLAISVMGGLLVSTFLTLVVIPAILIITFEIGKKIRSPKTG